MENGPKLGELITDGDRRRDAIHVAIAPVTAAHALSPGQHVGFVHPDSTEVVGTCDCPIGIIDPFLDGPVEEGQRCWMLLYPGAITSLRHAWTHPAFAAVAALVTKRLS